jgi:hypothetical protein
MMDEIGLFGAINLGNFGYRTIGTEEPVAAATPSDRMHGETFLSDTVTMCAYPGSDDDFEPRCVRGASDRQPMRPEIPIFGDQEEQLSAPHRGGPRDRR